MKKELLNLTIPEEILHEKIFVIPNYTPFNERIIHAGLECENIKPVDKLIYENLLLNIEDYNFDEFRVVSFFFLKNNYVDYCTTCFHKIMLDCSFDRKSINISNLINALQNINDLLNTEILQEKHLQTYCDSLKILFYASDNFISTGNHQSSNRFIYNYYFNKLHEKFETLKKVYITNNYSRIREEALKHIFENDESYNSTALKTNNTYVIFDGKSIKKDTGEVKENLFGSKLLQNILLLNNLQRETYEGLLAMSHIKHDKKFIVMMPFIHYEAVKKELIDTKALNDPTHIIIKENQLHIFETMLGLYDDTNDTLNNLENLHKISKELNA